MSPLEVPDGPQPDPPDAPEPPDPPPDGPEPPDPDEPEGEPEPQADPTTEELRLEQFRLQETERDRAADRERAQGFRERQPVRVTGRHRTCGQAVP